MSTLPICLRPWTGFDLDDVPEHWGHVRPCCWSQQYFGDATKSDWSDIWNSNEARAFRQRMLAGDLQGLCPPHCPKLAATSPEKRRYLLGLIRRPNRNRLLNFMEILRKSTVLHSRPLYVKASPTVSCNLRCIMCYQAHEVSLNLSESTVTDLLELAKTAEFMQVQGGELFSSRRGLDFVARLAALPHAPPLGIITNGTFPIAAGWELLKRLSIRWITVSLDAANAETFQRIRVGGKWEEVLANVRRLIAYQQEGPSTFDIYLSFTVMSVNFREIPAFLNLAENLGVDATFNLLTPEPATAALNIGNNPTLNDEMQEILIKGLRYCEEHRLKMALDSLKALQETAI